MGLPLLLPPPRASKPTRSQVVNCSFSVLFSYLASSFVGSIFASMFGRFWSQHLWLYMFFAISLCSFWGPFWDPFWAPRALKTTTAERHLGVLFLSCLRGRHLAARVPSYPCLTLVLPLSWPLLGPMFGPFWSQVGVLWGLVRLQCASNCIVGLVGQSRSE